MTSHSLPLADGRELSYAIYGAPAGRAVVALHGTPGSRLTWQAAHDAAVAAGIRIIAPERPGFGNSSAGPLSFHGYAEDLRQLLDHLGIETATIAGVSGGAGYAIAAGLVLPERFDAVWSIAGLLPGAPRSALAGRLRLNNVTYGLARVSPRLLSLVMRRPYRALAAVDASTVGKLSARLPEPDRAVVMTPGVVDHFRADVQASTVQGLAATAAEMRLYAVSPALDLASIRVPVHLLHGSLDENVPIGVSRWAAGQLRDATLTVIDGAGHMFLLNDPGQLLSRL